MIAGALWGAALGTGVVLLVGALTRRRPRLIDRVAPYVPQASIGGRRPGLTTAWLSAAGDRLGRWLGGAASVQRRLDRLGSTLTVSEFRVRQLFAGFIGLGIAAAVALWLSASGSPHPVAMVVLVVGGFAAGVLARDQWLTSVLRRREQRQAEEFPVVADYVALAVAAGETPLAALERVLAASGGELSGELRTVVAEARTGTPFTAAMDRLAARTGVASIARFAEALAVAVERGTPLVDVLHAQAADVREAARRDLIESAARREVAMMVPVVFLLLPTTVVVAFYPGLVGLSLGVT